MADDAGAASGAEKPIEELDGEILEAQVALQKANREVNELTSRLRLDPEQEDVSVEQIAAALRRNEGSVHPGACADVVSEDEIETVFAVLLQDAAPDDPAATSAAAGPIPVPPGEWCARWGLPQSAAEAEATVTSCDVIRQPPAVGPAVRKLWVAAREGQCDEWELTGDRGLVALIVLLDRFSRLYGVDSKLAYASDVAAHTLAKAVADALDADELSPIERLFLLLPFLGQEAREPQEEAVRLLDAWDADFAGACGGPSGLSGWLRTVARTNLLTLATFGRFPHRNAAKGRRSTVQEEKYLSDHRLG